MNERETKERKKREKSGTKMRMRMRKKKKRMKAPFGPWKFVTRHLVWSQPIPSKAQSL